MSTEKDALDHLNDITNSQQKEQPSSNSDLSQYVGIQSVNESTNTNRFQLNELDQSKKK